MSKLGLFSINFISKKKSVTPPTSNIGNSLSECSQTMKKIRVVEVFHANVLKGGQLREKNS